MKEQKKKALARLGGWLDELLFPGSVMCLCCRRALKEEGEICLACMEAMERLRCMQEERERTKPLERPAGLEYVHAAFPYEGPVRQLIHRLKYDGIRAAHIHLAQTMALLPSGEEEVIVPVPTDSMRLRQRGYNQAELLARRIGKTLGMQVETALVRKEHRRPQTGLSAALRQINLAGCMEASAAVSGRRVLLVDDVYTTGATAQEAARALKAAGAKSVAMFAAAVSSPQTMEETDPFALPQNVLNRAKKLKIPDKNCGEL